MRGLLLFAAIALLPGTAAAQFYDLDGAYHCLTGAKDDCGSAPPEPHQAPAPLAQPQPAEPPPPSLADAIERVKRRDPSARDIAVIEERAAGEDPKAVEVLAWCKLNGIGMKPDAVGAYLLYQDAARRGVTNAKANARAIYENRLSSAERQQVLVKENGR